MTDSKTDIRIDTQGKQYMSPDPDGGGGDTMNKDGLICLCSDNNVSSIK